MSLVLGVDPGGAQTGLVLAQDRQLLSFDVVDREDPGDLAGYIHAVLDRSRALIEDHPGGWVDLIAIEAVTAPKGFTHGERHPINPRDLISVSAVLGAFIAWGYVDEVPVFLIPPGGNGSAPLRTYPPSLVGAREKSGSGRLRHCRSAWDVSQTVSFIKLRSDAARAPR